MVLLALHELDPAFRKVTLENDRLQALVRDLKFHQDPVGMGFNPVLFSLDSSQGSYSSSIYGHNKTKSNRWGGSVLFNLRVRNRIFTPVSKFLNTMTRACFDSVSKPLFVTIGFRTFLVRPCILSRLFSRL